MISCYSLEQPTSYSLVDVADSLPLSPSVSLWLSLRRHRTVAGTRTSVLIRMRKIAEVSLCSFKTCHKRVSLFFRTVLSFFFFCPFPLLKGPPPLSDQCSFSVFIAHNDYTSLRLPYLFISMEPTPNYTHQRWGSGGGVWGGQVWLQFQTSLDFLLLKKRALGKLKGCFLFSPLSE